MKATTRRKGASVFSMSVEVDVDIDPDELEEAGWTYVGDEDRHDAEALIDAVRRWHGDSHDSPWLWCSHEVCEAAR